MAEKRALDSKSTPSSNKRVRFNEEEGQELSAEGTLKEATGDELESKSSAGMISTGQASQRKINISRINSRKWNRFVALSRRWEQTTMPYEPSFVILYWQQLRGRRKQLVWTGARHMQEFVENKSVQQILKNVAMSRPAHISEGSDSNDNLAPKRPDDQCSRIQLPSRDPALYRSDILYKIIPQIVNPKNKRKFYTDANKPGWYPLDVAFKSPNHPKVGESKLSAEDMRKVLKAFLEKCQENYSISDDSITKQPMANDTEEKFSNGLAVPPSVVSPIRLTPLSPDGALSRLRGYSDWEAFADELEEIRLRVDLSNVANIRNMSLKTFDDIPSHLIDKTRKAPNGFTALVATGNGNCMYNSVSLLIFGSERYASHLRLLSAIHALDHFDHYLATLSNEIQEIDTAQQFVATVASNMRIVEQRPQDNPTLQDLLVYILKTEILAASRDGEYSGFLQILFLAGALQHPIQQHCGVEYEFYNLLVPPCACCDAYGDIINIMWVRMIEEESLLLEPNHIIPLVCDTSVSVSKVTLDPLAPHAKKTCIMSKLGQCVLTKYTSKKVDWVKCDQCHSWYHCACIGICQEVCTTIRFICCADESTNPEIFTWPWPMKAKQSSTMMFGDVKSLYPGNGLSDAVIDFYARSFLLQSPSVTYLSALTYTAIERFEGSKSPPSSLLSSHHSVNGHHSIGKPIIGFPCRVKGFWHWILIAVALDTQKAFIFDSLCNGLTPYAMEAINGIQVYLNAISAMAPNLLPCANVPNPLVLDPIPVKVSQQKGGVECGIHVINNMKILSKLSGSTDDMFNSAMFTQPVNSTDLRIDILYESFQVSKRYHHARKVLKGTSGSGVTLRSSTVDKEAAKHDLTADMIKNCKQDGLQVRTIEGKGRGITTTVPFEKGDYVCSYSGDLLTRAEGIEREKKYSNDVGCYIFFFSHKGQDLCIDASKDDGGFGRLINHSKKAANVSPKIMLVQGTPNLYFEAIRDISNGEEILYDYNDNRKSSTKEHPWLLK